MLNLIEVRRRYAGEHISGEAVVGSERFGFPLLSGCAFGAQYDVRGGGKNDVW